MKACKLNRSIRFAFILLSSCGDFLDEEVYTQYDPEAFLQTEEGINSVLVASYSNLHVTNRRNQMYYLNEFTGDQMWAWGGSAEANIILFMTFNWDSQNGVIEQPWQGFYEGIRNANSLLDNIDQVTSLSSERLKQYKAEARFIRAAAYYYLWELFGPVPLITTAAEVNLEPRRATDEEFNRFIAEELLAAADDLPKDQDLWGKATKGAALALLGKFYLNTHQWEQAAAINGLVMDSNAYSLYSGGLREMFSVENEENDEVVLTSPALPTLNGNPYMTSAFPPNYPILSNWMNFGVQFCVYNDWVKTYEPGDKRLEWFLFTYTERNGTVHNLLDPNDAGRAVRCFKYLPDPVAIGANHGNDVPMIRYAEVLLNRAEALNELDGPNQESVDLLNEIRRRAGVHEFSLSDFPTKEHLRDVLLDERGFEFVAEGQRRMDLIRHGKFVSQAVSRGAENARDYMTRFPIPHNEIEANPNLTQNPGY